MAALAAAAGLTDYLGDDADAADSAMRLKHMLANVTAVVLELVNLVLRLNNPDFIASTGVYISGVVVLILLYSGWKGGDLVFPARRWRARQLEPVDGLRPLAPTAALRSSTRSSRSHGNRSPSRLRPKWP